MKGERGFKGLLRSQHLPVCRKSCMSPVLEANQHLVATKLLQVTYHHSAHSCTDTIYIKLLNKKDGKPEVAYGESTLWRRYNILLCCWCICCWFWRHRFSFCSFRILQNQEKCGDHCRERELHTLYFVIFASEVIQKTIQRLRCLRVSCF